MCYANYDMYDMKTIHGILCSCIYVIHKAFGLRFRKPFQEAKAKNRRRMLKLR